MLQYFNFIVIQILKETSQQQPTSNLLSEIVEYLEMNKQPTADGVSGSIEINIL